MISARTEVEGFSVGDKVTYTSPYDNEPKNVPATIVMISEPWTTGMVPIKVRQRGGRHEWTLGRFLAHATENHG